MHSAEVVRRRPLLGLRGRVTAAVILTSALTLVVAALTLLAPLEQRLRADAVSGLTETTLAARSDLAGLSPRDSSQGSRALRAAVDEIARRTRADVAVVDANGRVLAASGRGARRYPDVAEAVGAHRVVAGIADGTGGTEVRVAVPVRRARRVYGLSLRRPLTSVTSAVRVVRRSFLLAALVAMAAAVAVGTAVPRRLVVRLDALRDAVARADERAPTVGVVEGRDEVADLARAFAAMQRRVVEQEQARRSFVATASHELRTPLTSLHLMLDLLREDLQAESPDLEDARAQASRAAAQSARITRLAVDLLDLSRVDAAVPLRDELVDLRELGRAVVAEFEPADGVALALEPAGSGPVWVRGDPDGIAQILRIVLDNALRFAPAGTSVTVSAAWRGDRAELAVSDAGPGVPEQDRERIFERFERGSGGTRGAGFGLGLAIGRELARRMNGDLRLASAGSPTRFSVELTAARGVATPLRLRGAGSPHPAR